MVDECIKRIVRQHWEKLTYAHRTDIYPCTEAMIERLKAQPALWDALPNGVNVYDDKMQFVRHMPPPSVASMQRSGIEGNHHA